MPAAPCTQQALSVYWLTKWMKCPQNTDSRESAHQNHLLARNSLLSEGSHIYHSYDSQQCLLRISYCLWRSMPTSFLNDLQGLTYFCTYWGHKCMSVGWIYFTKNHTIPKEVDLAIKLVIFTSIPLFAERGDGGSGSERWWPHHW